MHGSDPPLQKDSLQLTPSGSRSTFKSRSSFSWGSVQPITEQSRVGGWAHAFHWQPCYGKSVLHIGRWWKGLDICRTPLAVPLGGSLWAARDLSRLHCGLTLILPKLVSVPFLLQLFLPINFCTFRSSSYLFSGESNLWPLVPEVAQENRQQCVCRSRFSHSLADNEEPIPGGRPWDKVAGQLIKLS